MTALRESASFMRLFALVAILALVATACGGYGTATPGDSDEPEASQDAGESTAPDASEDPGTGGELGTYTLGIFQDVTTDNQWNSIDSAGNTVWNSYFLNPMLSAAYAIVMPGIELAPSLAEGELQPAVEEGDVWIGEITLREGLLWSDGEAITAEDFAFTWQTAVDLELVGPWEDYVDSDIVTAVEAVDDLTVRVTFNAQPGPIIKFLLNGLCSGFRLKAERIAGEVDHRPAILVWEMEFVPEPAKWIVGVQLAGK